MRECDEACWRALAKSLGLPALAARVLVARGVIDPDEAALFLRPPLAQLGDPFALKGMEAAVARVGAALERGEKIFIWGDYDVDGISATAILFLTFAELGRPAEYYIPHRVNEGYGLKAQGLEQIAADGAQLVITVDCGTTAVEEARRACELGLDLIVTDHHEPGAELPECVAVINPRQPGCGYPCKHLAGAGVAFKLAHALLKRFHKDEARAREFLRSLLDLVALGTVADIVPLTGENRAIVTAGLERMRSAPRVGIAALAAEARLEPAKIDSGSIGFVLGPRLNAAGRTEHAIFGVELLLTEDKKKARELAAQLNGFNENRRTIESSIVREALELLEGPMEDHVIVVAQDGWHHGVLGIVASRIQSRYFRPVIVLGIEGAEARGSGRSIPGFDLHGALTCCGEHLERFGGHVMAAGMSLTAAKIDGFREAINRHAAEILTEEMMRPLIEIDAVAEVEELTAAGVQALDLLAPFGLENPKPLVAIEELCLIEPPRIMKERHMKLTLAGGNGRTFAAVGWGMSRRAAELEPGMKLRVAGSPFLNTWNGRTSVEVEMKDFQVAG